MKYIILGAGHIGLYALQSLGNERVECFADNHKQGTTILGKKVISFAEMVLLKDQFHIVIATNRHTDTFEKQLQEAGIHDYFLFGHRKIKNPDATTPQYNTPYQEQYMSYADILSYSNIYKYKKILIYGINKHINDLLFEIEIQNNIKNVVGIIDTSINEPHYLNIPVVTLENAPEYDCLIINKKRNESNIRDLISQDHHMYDIIDLYDIEKHIAYNHHPELLQFKDLHKGQRAFILGNGPSLTVKDLNTLHAHNAVCFAANKIYKIYDQTPWRPTYLCMADNIVVDGSLEELSRLAEDSTVFLNDCQIKRYYHIPKLQPVHIIAQDFAPYMPGFSDDIVKGVYLGNSVTYDLSLQIAAYMGFREIYLLGVDNNFISTMGTHSQDHFIKDYLSDDEKQNIISKNVAWDQQKVDLAYQKAEIYSRTNGFRIFNATRGGALEAFERIDFDSLF